MTNDARPIDRVLAQINALNPFQLANEADCASPNATDSAGAKMLERVVSDFAEALEYAYNDDEDLDVKEWIGDASHEIADNGPSIYTHEKWAQFADLGAREDPSELGYGSDGPVDMDQLAGVCLYIIAQRLAYALADVVADAFAEIAAEK